MERCVIDCSVAASWFLQDEYTESSEKLLNDILTRKKKLILPDLWWYEILNVLHSSVKRGRMKEENLQKTLHYLKNIPVSIVASDNMDKHLILKNSMNYNITAYDSTYLTLAETNAATLYTNDKDLLKLKNKLKFIRKQ